MIKEISEVGSLKDGDIIDFNIDLGVRIDIMFYWYRRKSVSKWWPTLGLVREAILFKERIIEHAIMMNNVNKSAVLKGLRG